MKTLLPAPSRLPVSTHDRLLDEEIQAASEVMSLAAQEQDEDARLIALAEQYEVNGQSCVEDDETTLWLKYTQWPARLADKPLDILSASTQKPAPFASDYTLGSWTGYNFDSPAEDEAKLCVLMTAVDHMFERAIQTLEGTHNRIRCWLGSYYEIKYRPMPFMRPQKTDSEKRYIGVWKQFLCYVFRAWATEQPLREEIYGLQFQKTERALMNYVWSTLLEPQDIEDKNGGDDAQLRHLSEAIFQLSVCFWVFRSPDGDMYTSAIIKFAAVMGIQRETLVYKSAYCYTPTLSALIWVGRVLLLEYALPLRAYETLGQKWLARDSYDDQVKRFQEIRIRYMLRGGFHAMGECIDMRAYGRAIVKKEGARANLCWSADGTSFSINDKNVHLLEFTSMHREVVALVERRTSKLMLGWRPAVDLSLVKDDLTCNTIGWSFTQAEDNKLKLAYKEILQRAWKASTGMAENGNWRMTQCVEYLDDCNAVSGEIWAAIHITAGLPPRGSEGTAVKVYNAAQELRNVFIINGRVAIVFEYNKSRAANNHSFFIVRYLPSKLGTLVFNYLAYIRPFADFLCTRIGLSHRRHNEFLFQDPSKKQKHLSSDQATAILRRLTSHFTVPMTISLYRQASLAIAERYISKLIQYKKFYEPRNATDPIKMLQMGAGHNPRTLLTAYAIDKTLPTRLQSELLELYLQLSTTWQHWNEKYYNDHCELQAAQKTETSQKRPAISTPCSVLPAKRLCVAEASPQFGSGSLDDAFVYNSQYRVLICRPCGSAIIPGESGIGRHLRKHNIKGESFKLLCNQFVGYDLAQPHDLESPKPGGFPISGLHIQDGYSCTICCSYRTLNKAIMRRHMSSEHKLKPQCAERALQFRECQLQSFFIGNPYICYFEVEPNRQACGVLPSIPLEKRFSQPIHHQSVSGSDEQGSRMPRPEY